MELFYGKIGVNNILVPRGRIDIYQLWIQHYLVKTGWFIANFLEDNNLEVLQELVIKNDSRLLNCIESGISSILESTSKLC
jgi:hypothetical protein